MRRRHIHPVIADEVTDHCLEELKKCRISVALKTLSPDHRTAMEDRHIFGFADEDIACHLGVTINEARRLTFVAEENFRDAYTADQAKLLGWSFERTAEMMNKPDRLKKLFKVFEVPIADLTLERMRDRLLANFVAEQQSRQATRPGPGPEPNEKRPATVRTMPSPVGRQPT